MKYGHLRNRRKPRGLPDYEASVEVVSSDLTFAYYSRDTRVSNHRDVRDVRARDPIVTCDRWSVHS